MLLHKSLVTLSARMVSPEHSVRPRGAQRFGVRVRSTALRGGGPRRMARLLPRLAHREHSRSWQGLEDPRFAEQRRSWCMYVHPLASHHLPLPSRSGWERTASQGPGTLLPACPPGRCGVTTYDPVVAVVPQSGTPCTTGYRSAVPPGQGHLESQACCWKRSWLGRGGRWRWCGGSGAAGGSWSGLHCGWRWSVRGGGQECPRSFAQGHMPAGVEVVERQAQREVSLLAGIRRPSLPGEEKEWRRGLRVAVVHVRISGTITPCPLTRNEAAGVPPTP
jgi:hypothetical protein